MKIVYFLDSFVFQDTMKRFGLCLCSVFVGGDGYVTRGDEARPDFQVYTSLVHNVINSVHYYLYRVPRVVIGYSSSSLYVPIQESHSVMVASLYHLPLEYDSIA